MVRWFARFMRRLAEFFFGSARILCDTCKYDYPSACRNPERPNAQKCKEYARRS
ncbi:MAG: hypothetical protein GXP25_12065 [Planctomycetes bacterium]|nr:hypothetical protein [Planctomycetota bacterium]